MPYIRTNEDYYASLGMSPKAVLIAEALDEVKIDYGFCNPRKAREAAELEEEIRKKVEEENP